MSHAATTFILQKSNEMLSIFKALKRKTNIKNINHSSNGATTTQNDGTKSTKRISSAVNCMHSRLHLNDDCVSLSNNSDASHSNIYTEIELHDDLLTKDLVTQPSSTDSNESTLSSDILRFLFNDINSVHSTCNHDASETKNVNCYVNETVISHAIVQVESKLISDGNAHEHNLYDIGNGHNVTADQRLERSIETNKSDIISQSSIQRNVACVGESIEENQKHMMNDSEAFAGVLAKTVSDSELTKRVDGDKTSFRKRFKDKFKAGLQFFKDAKVRYRCIK